MTNPYLEPLLLSKFDPYKIINIVKNITEKTYLPVGLKTQCVSSLICPDVSVVMVICGDARSLLYRGM